VTVPAWFEDFAEAVAAGDPERLVCGDCGDASLPPRRLCPACGSADLRAAPLSDRGEVLSFTEISVTIPKFYEAAPYTVVLVGFPEGVALAGQLRGASAEDLAVGDAVALGVDDREAETPVLTFRPVEA
jgi:hypothetical protein